MVAERRGAGGAAPDQLRHDPIEVRRHAQRMRGTRDRGGALATIVRYGLIAAVVAAGVVGYRNFDTVRGVALDLAARAGLAGGGSGPADVASPGGEEPETVVVEGQEIAGAAMPTAIGGAPPTPEAAATDAPLAATPPAAAPPADDEAAAAPAEPPVPSESVAAAEPIVPPEPAAEPEPPPGPETFELASGVVNVSEAAASAAVLVLRNGDRSRVSTVVWSTRDGTATAGSDYIDRGAVVERFAAGEQNRTIHVPIVGDRNAEGPEDFYVVLAADGAPVGDVREVRVVIDDDD
jgi:hypothetical protein